MQPELPASPSITTADLCRRLLRRELPVLVDALGPDFFVNAHIPGAINITSHTAVDRIRALIPDTSVMVVVYGSADAGSAHVVAQRLTSLGYVDVCVLQDGKEGWAEAGLPLEHGPANDPG